MVYGLSLLSRWRNGLALLHHWQCYLRVPEFKTYLRSVEFFACNKNSTHQLNPNSNICVVWSIHLGENLSETIKKGQKSYNLRYDDKFIKWVCLTRKFERAQTIVMSLSKRYHFWVAGVPHSSVQQVTLRSYIQHSSKDECKYFLQNRWCYCICCHWD